jgi:hypothetical protein
MQALQYGDNDRFMIDNLSILTGLTFEQVRQVFEFLLLLQMADYMEGKPITVPYLGKLSVEYIKDEIIRGHKRALLDVKFEDSELLKRMIGEIEDGENTTVLAVLKGFIENQLLYLLQEESQNGGKTRKQTRKREFSFPKTFSGTGHNTGT